MGGVDLGRTERPCGLRSRVSVAVALLLALPLAPAAGEPPPPTRRTGILELRNLMTRDEFRAAGLEKLSSQELASLDDWVGRMMVRALVERRQAGCASLIETRVAGEFQGWSGDTVFALENGQVWKQVGSATRHAYRVSPRVFIYRVPTGCKLKVDGIEGEVLVERLK